MNGCTGGDEGGESCRMKGGAVSCRAHGSYGPGDRKATSGAPRGERALARRAPVEPVRRRREAGGCAFRRSTPSHFVRAKDQSPAPFGARHDQARSASILQFCGEPDATIHKQSNKQEPDDDRCRRHGRIPYELARRIARFIGKRKVRWRGYRPRRRRQQCPPCAAHPARWRNAPPVEQEVTGRRPASWGKFSARSGASAEAAEGEGGRGVGYFTIIFSGLAPTRAMLLIASGARPDFSAISRSCSMM